MLTVNLPSLTGFTGSHFSGLIYDLIEIHCVFAAGAVVCLA